MRINKGFRIHGDYDIQSVGSAVKIKIDNKEEIFDFSMLAVGEEYTVTDCKILPYMPIQKIKINPGEIEVDVFFDDWYKINPQQFNRSKIEYLLVPTVSNNLEMAKEAQVPVITSAFDKEIETGHFMSTALGIEVDCRRSDRKNDKQNVKGLISNMSRNSKSTVNYVGYSEVKTGVTKEQLETLVAEMEDHVLALYEKKWTKQSEIQLATTIEQVKAIMW
jgi:hypothetical protein